jgi:hypothetical protein
MPITGTPLLVTAQRRRDAGPAKLQAVMNIKAYLYHQPREARNPGEGSAFEEGSLLKLLRIYGCCFIASFTLCLHFHTCLQTMSSLPLFQQV